MAAETRSNSSTSSDSAVEAPASLQPGEDGASSGHLQLLEAAAGPSCGGAAAPEMARQEAWWQILKGLQQGGPPPGQDEAAWVTSLLNQALASVAHDDQWNCSGIPELLKKALDTAQRGSTASARKSAVGLLDFHFLVEKYRTVVTRSSSSQSADSGKRPEDGAAVEVQSPAKRMRCDAGEPSVSWPGQQQQQASPTGQAPSGSAGAAAEFVKPTQRASSLRSTASAGAPPSASPQRRSTAKPVLQPVTWAGSVTQDVHGRTVTYCNLSVAVPAEYAHEFSPVLEASHLAPRKGVKLGEHYVCKCTVAPLSRSQTAKLKSLAQHELVLVVPLADNGVILVPYLDNAGQVKLVGFFVVC